MSPVELYENCIVPRLGIDDVYRGIQWRRRSDRSWRGPCPLHGGMRPNFAVDPDDLSWCCHSECQAGGGPIQYLDRLIGGDGRPRGRRYVELTHELARRVGIEPSSPPAAIPLRRAEKISAKRYPTALEVDLFWERCRPLDGDPSIADQLAKRGLDAAGLASLDVARLAPLTDAPPWSGYQKNGVWRSWPSAGLPIVLPLYDSAGRMRAFRFRAVETLNGMKAAPCTGFSLRGLVMADSAALQMLETGAVPEWWADGDDVPFSAVIAEGETDFWSFASRVAEQDYASLRYPAVLGIVSGSITHEILDRIPNGTQVISAVDRDEAGQRYHATLTNALDERWRNGRISIVRWNGGHDARR